MHGGWRSCRLPVSCSLPGGELPSVAAIAVAAGPAKGTVHLYFRSEGEIFALHPAGWLG